ncbi:MAG: hypothetical protein ACWA5X_13915 [bacterium]
MYSVNVCCLDDFDLDAEEYELLSFDGQNWEEAVALLNEELRPKG